MKVASFVLQVINTILIGLLLMGLTSLRMDLLKALSIMVVPSVIR